jgi:prepilin-type N-terminal cleavage/methylation domain-containing protein
MEQGGTASKCLKINTIHLIRQKRLTDAHQVADQRSGFSLFELILALVIVGVLAAIAIPRLSAAANRSAMNATLATFRQIETAIQMYRARTGTWPPNYLHGQQPAELNPYLAGSPMNRRTPIGGSWDWNGVGSTRGLYGLNVGITNLPPAKLAEFDAMFDDGDLTTGNFRQDNGSLVMPIGMQ